MSDATVRGMCLPRMRLVPFVGLVLRGDCGESLTLGVSVALTPEMIPPTACEEFRTTALQAFGPGGPRALEREEALGPFDQIGSRPQSRVDPELAEVFARRGGR